MSALCAWLRLPHSSTPFLLLLLLFMATTLLLLMVTVAMAVGLSGWPEDEDRDEREEGEGGEEAAIHSAMSEGSVRPCLLEKPCSMPTTDDSGSRRAMARRPALTQGDSSSSKDAHVNKEAAEPRRQWARQKAQSFSLMRHAHLKAATTQSVWLSSVTANMLQTPTALAPSLPTLPHSMSKQQPPHLPVPSMSSSPKSCLAPPPTHTATWCAPQDSCCAAAHARCPHG